MRATDVRILPALNPGESYIAPCFLLVETTEDERGETVTSIDHVSIGAANEEGKAWSAQPLWASVEMEHPAAREWAVAYAAQHDVPIVYERDETA